MNIQSIWIGNHKYLIEKVENVYNSAYFVMLRNFTFINGMVVDKDILFIQKDIFDKFKNEDIDSHFDSNEFELNDKPIQTEQLVFPIPDTHNSGYSKSFDQFNSSIFAESLKYENAVYHLYKYNDEDDMFYESPVKCQKIRIYHPVTKSHLDAVIHIDNIINGIHFHFLCNKLNNFSNNSDTEIKSDNQYYSEYIEVMIPDVSDLFGFKGDKIITKTINKITGETEEYTITKHLYNFYYIEDMAMAVSSKNNKFLETIIFEDPEFEDYIGKSNKESNNIHQFVPINLFLQTYSVTNEISYLDINNKNALTRPVKVYYKNKILVEDNQLSMPFNITIFPYSTYDENTCRYTLDDQLTPDTCTFMNEYKIELGASLGFSNGRVSIVSDFIFPGYDSSTTKFSDLYKILYGINSEEYNIDKYVPEIKLLDEITEISDNIKISMNDWLKSKNYNTPYDEVEWLQRFKEMRKEHIIKEYEEDLGTPVDFIGYIIEIASDKNFKHIVYQRMSSSSIDNVNKFSFNIDGIFTDWKQKPEILVARTKFIDRYTGVTLISNIIPITNTWFRYILHNEPINRIDILNRANYNMKQIVLNKDIQNQKNTAVEKIDILRDDIESIKQMYVNFSNEILGSLPFDPLATPTPQASSEVDGDSTPIPISTEQAKSIEFFEKLYNSLDKTKSYLTSLRDSIKDINELPVNFIEYINCSVEKPNNINEFASDRNNSKIIFKPIFYKVQELQTIRLRVGLTQNIGINLSDYMTKVSAFKLHVEDNEYIEIARNSAYVIFSIDTQKLTKTSGRYDITDQNDTYISSGSWSLY